MNAQTITSANFATNLTATSNIVVDNTSSFNVGLTSITGNGVTWDASALTINGAYPVIHLSYFDPITTPNGVLFPTANYVNYDPALTAIVSYEYSHLNADSMVSVGTYSPSTAHEIFQDPDKFMVFPFSLSNSFVDSYAKTNYSDATTISSYQTGTRTVSYTGYGNLILPQGTFTNVALISEVRTNSLGPDSYVYTWYDVSNGKSLLRYSSNNGSVLVAHSQDPVASVNNNLMSSSVLLYPNPASTSFNIISSDKILSHNLELIDLTGKKVKSNHQLIGDSKIEFSLVTIEPGIYFVKGLINNKNINMSLTIK
jgi:hypothetical protein